MTFVLTHRFVMKGMYKGDQQRIVNSLVGVAAGIDEWIWGELGWLIGEPHASPVIRKCTPIRIVAYGKISVLIEFRFGDPGHFRCEVALDVVPGVVLVRGATRGGQNAAGQNGKREEQTEPRGQPG